MHPPVAPPILKEVRWVNRYERTNPTHRFSTSSLPGHLIQCMVAGKVRQRVSGQDYELGPGDLIWYYQDEHHEGQVAQTPWVYYSVNFIAPALSPPPLNRRVWRVTPQVVQLFDAVWRAWQDETPGPLRRAMRVQARVLLLLAEIASEQAQAFHADPAAQIWWEIERQLREDPSKAVNLPEMVRMTGRSPATIGRACRAALGISPMRRVKQIRMGHAQGLVELSELSMSEISSRVGYGRIHEFSRDFSKHFGVPPTTHRDKFRREGAQR